MTCVATSFFQPLQQRHEPQVAAYRMTALPTRVSYAACYVALVGFLALMTFELHETLEAMAKTVAR